MISVAMTASHLRSTTPTALFASAARALSAASQAEGLVVPGFRCPPRVIGVDRTLRRGADGTGGVIAVRIADRPFTAAIADMIEGVLAINRLGPPEADKARASLWRAMLQFTLMATDGRGDTDSSPKVA